MTHRTVRAWQAGLPRKEEYQDDSRLPMAELGEPSWPAILAAAQR